MSCNSTIFELVKGSSFRRVIRWEAEPLIAKTITGITQAAGAVVTAASHGVPDGWRVAVVSAGGMRQINAKEYPPLEDEFTPATVLTSNTVRLNNVNSLGYTAYTSGGALVYYTPVDMASYTARMTIRDRIGGTSLLALTSSAGITIDNTAKTITVDITAAQTAAMTFSEGVYDLEMVSADATPFVTKLLSGTVTVAGEVTT